MCKHALTFSLVFTLFFVLLLSKCGVDQLTVLSSPEFKPVKDFFEPDEAMNILIPSIGLQTDLGFAPVVGGRLDSSRLKKVPVLISPEARPGLEIIGLPGVSLILGHRQWGLKPLVFARLNELTDGDLIIIYNKVLRIPYIVRGKNEINPDLLWKTIDEVSGESLQENRSELILVTCAPYGYNRRRLLIFARRKVELRSGTEGCGGNTRP